jgi:hypothetical protein
MTWQTKTRAWLEKRGAGEWLDDCLLFFERAFEAPARLYPHDAWYGIHDSYASLTIGNMWLATLGTSPRCAYLIVEPTFEMLGTGFIEIRSTLRYAPLIFVTVKPWDRIHTLNQNEGAWESYARACELIIQSPVSRNVITRNLHRKARLSELPGAQQISEE